jgi:enamine deaminase RidA (YjgF/YER057c/UK114 family)
LSADLLSFSTGISQNPQIHPQESGAEMTHEPVNHVDRSIPFGFDQARLVTSPTQWLVCSGQTSIAPDGSVAHAGDMGAQIDAALASLTDLLAAAGMTLDDVVRITAYVTDVDAFLRARRTMPQCAYTLIGVSRLAYPELLVELVAIAAR